MFFELRQYRIFPGKRDQWVKFMEERIIPGQLAHGVVIVGSFVGQKEDDLYVWIRRFEDEEHLATFNATLLRVGRMEEMSCDHECRRCLTSRAW